MASQDSAVPPASRLKPSVFLILLGIVLLALGLRIWHVNDRGLSLDELWTMELSTARGSAHLHLPHETIISLPYDLTTLDNSPPAAKVWTTMSDCTHPPLYFLLLRIWREFCGAGDFSARLFSIVVSILSLLILFDLARLLHGPTVALCASALFALAIPQIDYGREVRNYAILALFTLLMGNTLIRILRLGPTRFRYLVLTSATLATLLTHYFCIGAILGMLAFVLLFSRGNTRRNIVICFVIAISIFAITWAPFMWQQRAHFATGDETTIFLQSGNSNLALRTLTRVLVEPVRLLANPPAQLLPFAYLLGAAFLALMITRSKRFEIAFWSLWYSGTIILLAAMDLFRGTDHLGYIRYPFLAGPAVYALIPSLTATYVKNCWIPVLVTAICLGSCLFSLNDFYNDSSTDPRLVAAKMKNIAQHDDLVVFVGGDHMHWQAGAEYLTLYRYRNNPISPCVLIDHAPQGDLLARCLAARSLYEFSDESPAKLFPSFKITAQMRNSHFVDVWQLKPQ